MAFRVEDEVLAPHNIVTLRYSGINPFMIYKRVSPLMQLIFQIKGKDIIESDFRWDTSEDPRGFYIRIWGERTFDQFTKLIIYVKLEGAQPTDVSKPGKMTIEFSGRLITSFPSESVIQKFVVLPFAWIYYRIFYKDVRRRFLDMSKRDLERLENELRGMLKLEQKISV